MRRALRTSTWARCVVSNNYRTFPARTFSMTSLRGQTARLVLGRVPESEQARVVTEVVKALDDQSSGADLGFAATLLDIQPDMDAQEALLTHLQRLVERGEHDQVLSILDARLPMRQETIARTVQVVTRTVSLLESAPGHRIAVPLVEATKAPVPNGALLEHNEGLDSSTEAASSSLKFLIRVDCHLETEHAESLLLACVSLLGTKDKRLCSIAQEALSSLLCLQFSFIRDHSALFWTRVRTLVSASDVFYRTLGFGLWLRWVASEANVDHAVLGQPEYWNAIIGGLRNGDSERRKASLQVLRLSIEVASKEPALRNVVAAGSTSEASSSAIQKQYSRFCNVFETIVLGRYLNQVMECEADLDFLSSKESVVKSIWLYTLLESALGVKMQESNRKFIGRWIMSSNLRADDFEGFISFFKDAFLPWLTTGRLFTVSLRKHNGALRCEHGDKVSNYVSNLLQSHPSHAGTIIDAILDSMFSRKGANFAYATVYLVDGMCRAQEESPAVDIRSDQVERIGRFTTWAGLPEIARDYIIARYWKLSTMLAAGEDSGSLSDSLSSAAAFWHKLLERASRLDASASAHIDGNMASMSLEPSKRDLFERNTIQKCEKLRAELDQAEPSAVDATHVESVVDDIWSDLEYLEYPKSLLAVLPRLLPHQRLAQAALAKPEEGNRLIELLTKKTQELLELAQARSYMLSPLAATVRHITLENPAAARIFDLEGFIIRLAEHPPSPTIDAELEDAIVPLLQSVDPSLAVFNYEFYFGPRESCGIASLLDLVTRLGKANGDTSKRILDHLLNRWLHQRIPPSVVTPWKTVLQLQVMLLCADQCLPTLGDAEVKALLKDLHFILAVEPLPRYRYLIEWMIARAYIYHPQTRSAIFDELKTKDHHSNPKFLASLMKLGVTIAKTDTAEENFAKQLSAVFVPLAASSKVVIRHEAQWQIPLLMDLCTSKGWTTVSEDPAFMALDEFIRSLERFGDPPLERQVDKLDPIRDHNLTHLVEGRWWKLDDIESPQASHADFERIYEADKVTSLPLPPSCMPLGPSVSTPPQQLQTNSPVTDSDTQLDSHSRKLIQNIDNISRALGSGPGPTSLALQSKHLSTTSPPRHNNLHVLASLIENPHNLGGLSRVSEIFGAASLLVQNPLVTSNKDFTNVSVSSHHHLPIHALPQSDTQAYLARKRREEGFAVVGIEQTDRSVMVGSRDCVLPEKCFLVIGSEREGIPAQVLGECDLLVEIPQLGVTRSLNVQTAAAIVLCEYAKQHQVKR